MLCLDFLPNILAVNKRIIYFYLLIIFDDLFFVILARKLGWQTGRNIETGTDSYAFKGNQWVGYDDKQTLRRKV